METMSISALCGALDAVTLVLGAVMRQLPEEQREMVLEDARQQLQEALAVRGGQPVPDEYLAHLERRAATLLVYFEP